MSTEFTVGSKVKIITLPSYVKTADSMPMLRPPDVIQVGEVGIVLDRKPGDYWSVKFAGGAFLMESQYMELVEEMS